MFVGVVWVPIIRLYAAKNSFASWWLEQSLFVNDVHRLLCNVMLASCICCCNCLY